MTGMGIEDPEVNRALHAQWRVGLAVVAVLLVGSGLVGIALAIGYREAPWGALMLLLSGLATVMAFRHVPRAVRPEERPAMARSALWIVVAIGVLAGGVLLLDLLGVD
jgi:uncharacterized membrane protein YfcA